MNCRQTQKAISAYLDGEITKAQWQPHARHCQTCRHCADLLVTWETQITSLRAAARAVPEADYDEVWTRIQSTLGEDRRPLGWWQRHQPQFAWAAAAVLLMALAYFIGRMQAGVNSPTTEVVSATTPATTSEVGQFLRHSQMLLLDVKHSQQTWDNADLRDAKQRAQALKAQVFLLRAAMNDQRADASMELLNQIEIMLMEIANLSESNPGDVELLRDQMQQQQILPKLHLLEPKISELLTQPATGITL